MSKHGEFKKGLAKQWRAMTAGQLPHSRDEFLDVVLDRADAEDVRTSFNGSHFKVIVSGHVVEVYEYEKPVTTGTKKRSTSHIVDEETGEVMVYDEENDCMVPKIDPETGCVRGYDPKEAKKNNARRARLNLRRIITSNFDISAKFVTLTFADGSISDVTNVRECNKAFDRFMKRMRKRYGNFKYVKVVEFQDSNDRGAVHFHMMADLPYIPHEKIAEVWGHGFIGVNRIDQVDNLGAYMTKYMMKNFDDPRLNGEKAYSTSQGLIRPIELHGEEAVEIIDLYTKDRKEVFANEYESEYQGQVKYKEFNLQREENE